MHFLIRITRRSLCQSFLRVLPGQIAQQFIAKGLAGFAIQDLSEKNSGLEQPEKAVTGPHTERRTKRLWKYRPFTRVVKGYKAYRIVRDYILLNEAEALGVMAYSKTRLRWLSDADLIGIRSHPSPEMRPG